MILKVIIFQSLVIAVAILWIAFARRGHWLDTAIKFVTIISLLIGLALAGLWVYPPRGALILITVIFLALLVRHLSKETRERQTLVRTLSAAVPVLFLFPLSLLLIWQGLSGRVQPAGTFANLTSPFKDDANACVLSGGSSQLMNLHNFPSDDPRDIGQLYGLDIIRKDDWGFRTTPSHRWLPKPQDYNHYAMFGTMVYAPCNGMVIDSVNGLMEQSIGDSTRINTSGNGVVLQCRSSLHIHLHHFKKGSVLVQVGDKVKAGDPLGRIGNSGNTREPHLHLHAETVVERGNAERHGVPVPILINGRFPVRGDCL